MINFQKKRGWKNIAQSRPVLALLGFVVLVFAYGVIGFMGKMQVTIENRKIAENKISELEAQKKELSAETAKLKTVSGIEASIREKYPVAKDGEGVIVIVEDKNEPKVVKQSPWGFSSFLTFWNNWFK